MSGWVFETVEEIGSTSDALIARAGSGAPERLALLAHRQTNGRGRQGRRWEDPGGSLALSILLRPEMSPDGLGAWVFVAGLALRDALLAFVTDGRALMLKWPNDVMLDGRKLGGVLIESGLAGGRVDWVVVGFGANLRQAPAVSGRETACLADGAGEVPAADAVASRLLEAWDRWAARSLAALREAWLGVAHAPGTLLTVDGVEGRFSGLAEDGSLLLDGAEGRRIVRAGEVVLGRRLANDVPDPTSRFALGSP